MQRRKTRIATGRWLHVCTRACLLTSAPDVCLRRRFLWPSPFCLQACNGMYVSIHIYVYTHMSAYVNFYSSDPRFTCIRTCMRGRWLSIACCGSCKPQAQSQAVADPVSRRLSTIFSSDPCMHCTWICLYVDWVCAHGLLVAFFPKLHAHRDKECLWRPDMCGHDLGGWIIHNKLT